MLVGAPARPGREVWVEQQMGPVSTDLAGQDDKIERGRVLLEKAAAQSAGGAPASDIDKTAIQLFALVDMDEATIRGGTARWPISWADEDRFFLRAEGLPSGKHEAGKISLSPALPKAIAAWVDDVAR